MIMRKMATIKRIETLEKHPNADTLDILKIGGWRVVAKSGLHKTNDYVVYCEIDSFIPTEIAPFLTKPNSAPKVFEGVNGEILKTIRLRGCLSQGLVIPISELKMLSSDDIVEHNDVSDKLGIKKWESPISESLAGEARGLFPSCCPKTDSERIQNLSDVLESEYKKFGFVFEVTEKLDGTSFTALFYDNEFHVCSRNLSMKEKDNNLLWNIAKKYKLNEILPSLGRNLAIQGEVLGPKIQGNSYKLTESDLYVFNIFDIDKQQYLTTKEVDEFSTQYGLKRVPFVKNYRITEVDTVDYLLSMADGKSQLNTQVSREGFVWKCIDNPSINFKTISNEWLCKN